MNRSIVIASHIARIDGKEYDGIGSSLKVTLDGMGVDYTFVRNSLDGLLGSQVEEYVNGVQTTITPLSVIRKPGPLRYLHEVYSVVKFFVKRNILIDVFVGIDPLNALTAILLKKKGIVCTAIFYTPDYSPKRFSLGALNWLYHKIDAYCVKNADEVWSVSSRIVAIRRDMGLEESKNIFLPNVPPTVFDNLQSSERKRTQLYTSGIIDKQLDFDGIFHAIKHLKGDIPEIGITIVGNGPEEERLRIMAKTLGISERVTFTGRVSLEVALRLLSECGIGIALYTGVWGFNMYGDSTKCREYFHFGLPVISTDTHSTVDEIREIGAGVVVGQSTEEYMAAIKTILDNYEEYQKQSFALGERYHGAHRRLLMRTMGLH